MEEENMPREKRINKENQDHRVGQKKRLDIACHSAWWTQIFNANKLVIILFICLALPNWTTTSTALPASSTQHNLKHSFVRRKASHKNSSLFSLSKVPTNTQQIRLFCRVGLFLSMDRNGTVSGVLQKNGTGEIFELQSFGPSIVRIKHKVTGLFIAMNNKGKVKGKRVAGDESKFSFTHEFNLFESFSSDKYYMNEHNDMFIALKRNGQVKSGVHTLPGQQAVQFLVMSLNKLPGNVSRSS